MSEFGSNCKQHLPSSSKSIFIRMIDDNNSNPIRLLALDLVDVTRENTRSTVALLMGKL